MVGKIYKVTPNSLHRVIAIQKGKLVIQAQFYTFNKFEKALVEMELAKKYITDKEDAFFHYAGYRKGNYPQVLHATDPFNPNSGGCGHISSGAHTSWANARSDTSGNAPGTNNLSVYSWRVSAGEWYVVRSFLPFDTSSLADDADITAADLNLYRLDSLDGFFNADSVSLTIVPSTQASNTALAAGDLDAVTYSSKGSLAYSSTSDASYFSIDITDLTVISLTSYTKLALVDSRDFSNTAPTGRNTIAMEGEEDSNPPILEVTYVSSIDYTETFNDTITLSDSLIKFYGFNKSLTDTITLSETFIKGVARTFSDTITLSDILTKINGYVKTFTDTITLSDTFTKSPLWRKLTSVSASFTKIVSETVGWNKKEPEDTDWTKIR